MEVNVSHYIQKAKSTIHIHLHGNGAFLCWVCVCVGTYKCVNVYGCCNRNRCLLISMSSYVVWVPPVIQILQYSVSAAGGRCHCLGVIRTH